MTERHRFGRLAALVLAVSLIAAACSGGDDAEATDDETTTTTTTEAVAADTTTTSTTVDDTTTTAPPLVGDGAPLTGLPMEVPLDFPALAVKIDNHPDSRPQTGLDLADIVFEARVEGITRFLAVFHSQQPSPVGPVRSSRTSDFDLLVGLDTPLYASSGGNDFVAAELRRLPILSVTAMSRTEYFRDGSRPAPHNLFTNTPDLFGLAPADATRPQPWFQYRAPGAELPASASPTSEAVTISYRSGPLVTHTWDAALGGWARTQDGRPHTNLTGEQLAPENVVIMVADYVTSAADARSPELVSVGSGQLFVLTDGHVIEGTWSRAAADAKPELVDNSGTPIALTPGRTWVLYPESGNVRLSES